MRKRETEMGIVCRSSHCVCGKCVGKRGKERGF